VLAGDVLTDGERGRGVRVRGGVCGQRAGCAGCNFISCAFFNISIKINVGAQKLNSYR
jgi:hypothetical protein